MLLSLGVALSPPQLLTSLKVVEPCSKAITTITVSRPSLSVQSRVVNDTLTLDAQLLSLVATSSEPNAYHAFIAVDGQLILLNLPSFGKISLTYPGLSSGTHFVRYGVFFGTNLLQDQQICPQVIAKTSIPRRVASANRTA